MSRIATLFALVWVLVSGAQAQEFGGLARVVPEDSQITSLGNKGVSLQLALSQGVPYRLFTLDAPRRLVLDFQEVDWTGLKGDRFSRTDRVGAVLFGTYVPGMSRMVVELASPMTVDRAELQVDPVSGGAVLELALLPATEPEFAKSTGAPQDRRWDVPPPENLDRPAPRGPDAPLRVMLDPGHGGIDPGAETERTNEKTLMLTFARELRELLMRMEGFEVMLTRETDHFVSLERRITLAHQFGADVFISLHADALAEGRAHGATVYTLSDEASDVASAKLAERHDRGDLLSGIDLSDTDDQVTNVLLQLARQETQPRTETLARVLADSMAQQGGPMNNRPLREASFSVLKAADIPSVLIELGFLSSPRDLKNISNPAWRATIAKGIVSGLESWRRTDTANRALVRR